MLKKSKLKPGQGPEEPPAQFLARKKREKLRRQAQIDRVEARRHRLKVIQDHDRQVDKTLLAEGRQPLNIKDFQGDPWFVSQDFPRDRNYILQYLGAYFKSKYPQDVLDAIANNAHDMEWIKLPFQGHSEDINDRFFDPNIMLLRKKVAATETPPGIKPLRFNIDRTWKVLEMAFELVAKLRVLRRFTDKRNPETMVRPTPDGTNLENSGLRAAWVLHRAWIRCLHYRSLYTGPDNYGVRQLFNILPLSMVFHHTECQSTTLSGSEEVPEYAGIKEMQIRILQALAAMGKDLTTETRRASTPYTRQETISYNTEDERITQSFYKNFLHLDKSWMLWAHLLFHGDEFERRMDVEHVEDCLIENRVVVRDEFWDLSQWMKGSGGLHVPDVSGMYEDDISENVIHVVRKISEVNRSRRNYLLLRDWDHKRPWSQLYYVFDTNPGEQDYLLEPISHFYKNIRDLKENEELFLGKLGWNERSPSRKSNILSGMFTIHPIAITKPPDCLNYDYFTEGCVLCHQLFRPTETVVQLKCNHLFHYTCLRRRWDTFRVQQFLCPDCKQDGKKWVLSETCAIIPEVHDVWDNAEVAGVDYARLRPDFEEGVGNYWVRENERLQVSKDWESSDIPRSVSVEMAHVRANRRARNARRRAFYQSNRQALAYLNP